MTRRLKSGSPERWIAMAAAAMFLCSGCQTPPPFVSPGSAPLSALVVWCHPVKQTARQIDNPTLVKQLESFFPAYRHRPAGPQSGEWLARYVIFVNFKDGHSLRLVSDGQVWSIGRGDLKVAGDFEGFAEELLNVRLPELPAPSL